MPHKDPIGYDLLTYGWVVALAAWGGIAGYVGKIKSGHVRFSISELVGEVCISGFVGVMTFYLCESAQFNPIASGAMIGVSGHMGSRAIFLFERVLQNTATKWLGSNDDDQR